MIQGCFICKTDSVDISALEKKFLNFVVNCTVSLIESENLGLQLQQLPCVLAKFPVFAKCSYSLCFSRQRFCPHVPCFPYAVGTLIEVYTYVYTMASFVYRVNTGDRLGRDATQVRWKMWESREDNSEV